MNQKHPEQKQHHNSPWPKTIRGVALDMDGLLFDTERLYWDVGDKILQRRGKRFCMELQHRMMGRVGTAAIQQMIDFHELSEGAEDLLEESNDEYEKLLVDGLEPMPGLDEWIAALQSSGLPFGLATSSQRRFVDIIFAEIDWRDDLAFILTGDDVTHGKPHPEMYLKAAEALGVASDEMLVLEDSGNGSAAAVAAGACTVAIPNDHTKDQPFDAVHLVADSLGDPMLHGILTL